MIIRLLTYYEKNLILITLLQNVILFGVDGEEIIEIEGTRRWRRRFRCLFIGAWKNVYNFKRRSWVESFCTGHAVASFLFLFLFELNLGNVVFLLMFICKVRFDVGYESPKSLTVIYLSSHVYFRSIKTKNDLSYRPLCRQRWSISKLITKLSQSRLYCISLYPHLSSSQCIYETC